MIWMVYTDGSHLIADSIQELYAYADAIGLNIEWIDFMGRNLHPHFHIFGHVKQRVLADPNVTLVSRRKLVHLSKLNYRLPTNEEELQDWEKHHNKKVTDLELPSESDYARMIDTIFKKSGLS